MTPQPGTPLDPLQVAPGPAPSVGKAILAWIGIFLTTGIGLYLLISPWRDDWVFNSIQDLTPSLEFLWLDPAFRGALSALGLANLIIAYLQILHRFSHRS